MPIAFCFHVTSFGEDWGQKKTMQEFLSFKTCFQWLKKKSYLTSTFWSMGVKSKISSRKHCLNLTPVVSISDARLLLQPWLVLTNHELWTRQFPGKLIKHIHLHTACALLHLIIQNTNSSNTHTHLLRCFLCVSVSRETEQQLNCNLAFLRFKYITLVFKHKVL